MNLTPFPRWALVMTWGRRKLGLALLLCLAGCQADREVVSKFNVGALDIRIVREIAPPTVSDYFTVEIDGHTSRAPKTIIFGARNVEALSVCYDGNDSIDINFKSADINQYHNYYYAALKDGIKRFVIELHKGSHESSLRCIGMNR